MTCFWARLLIKCERIGDEKILVTILLGVVSAVSLNADDLALANECLKKKQKSACQKLIDKGLPSVEKCVDGQVCGKRTDL